MHGIQTMAIIFIYCIIYFFNIVICYSDSESAESNRIEVTPFYDTIIYSDIADIINDFENNGISPFNAFANSESQSDEKIEDLLTEYQHHLEKAHKQRKNYIEKSKPKNKVPLLRHDQFSKPKPGAEKKHNDYYYPNSFLNSGPFKFSETYSNPLDVFIPINSNGKFLNKVEVTTSLPKGSRGDVYPFEKIIFNDKKILDLPPVIRKPSFDPIKSTCYCNNGQVPCDCNCKQCLIHIEPYPREPQMKMRLIEEHKMPELQVAPRYDTPLKKYGQFNDDGMRELNENTLNIRIKVDLQLPKLQEHIGKYKTRDHDKTVEPEDIISKELSTAIKLPYPFFNFPMPMELFDYKKATKYNKDDTNSLHKIMIHKKKKSRPNNNNKKHRKKIITFHNIKLEQQSLVPTRLNDNTTDMYKNKGNKNNTINETTIHPLMINVLQLDTDSLTNKTNDILNETQNVESLNSIVHNTNNTFTITEDSRKLENSIESDLTKTVSNGSTNVTLREKRETNKRSDKKTEKNILTDAELLYWPSLASNESTIIKKNITSIILENEHKKTKINMSKETLRQDHTRVLEQAIFGEVDWDDIDTVAPAFMSFVGKYVHGILTFCSQQVCHSMKCGNKTCLHRVCVPANRLNNKGHCAGTNSSDSVASMESIMDLPSNIAFEVVDILQNKMLGKIFGKATFCISTKCITLVSSKKTFIKSRCIIKELNTTGHCSNAKTVKIM